MCIFDNLAENLQQIRNSPIPKMAGLQAASFSEMEMQDHGSCLRLKDLNYFLAVSYLNEGCSRSISIQKNQLGYFTFEKKR